LLAEPVAEDDHFPKRKILVVATGHKRLLNPVSVDFMYDAEQAKVKIYFCQIFLRGSELKERLALFIYFYFDGKLFATSDFSNIPFV
jgi:hypothetical protein